MAEFTTDLAAKASLGVSLGLLLFLAVANASECATVSCATDRGEVSDRISSVALSLHASGSVLLWAKRRASTALAAMDVTLLLALAVVSSDVSGLAHNYIALGFIVVRVVLIVSTGAPGGALDLVSLFLVVALRSFSLVFLVGYACPNVIPETCASLARSTPLTRPVALAVETGMVVSGMAYMVAVFDERPGWRADALALLSFAVAIAGNAVLAIARPSPGAALLLTIGSLIDIALATRLWQSRDGRRVALESAPLAAMLLAPLVYALT